jgi:hypothetical protein
MSGRHAGRGPWVIARIAVCAAVVATLATLGPQAASGLVTPAAAETVTGRPATLTASSAALQGLAFDGVVDLPSAAGPLPALRLTGTTATLRTLRLHTGCTPVRAGAGLAVEIAGGGADAAVLGGGFTLLAVSITGTTPAGPVSWTPAAPPPAVIGDVALTDLRVELLRLVATTFTLPGLSEAASFCPLAGQPPADAGPALQAPGNAASEPREGGTAR